MTLNNIGMACWYIFLLLVLMAEIVWISRAVIRYVRETRQEVREFSANARYAKMDADKHGIEYAFGKAECDERDKIKKSIDHQSHRGLYSCELDFPVSQRSVEWLKHSGFEVSQADDGKTLVSWENTES